MTKRKVVAVGAAEEGERRSPLPEFVPVPRKYRYDGWTPERQKAFIEGLADTGSVTRAASRVNMAQANCYTLRRAAGAESFRQAWDAALDFGVKRLKDIAFERAIEGYLVPVFVGGKLMGFRRKYNDALLIFCLRHYGQDVEGKRTTVNYFSSRASAGAVGQAGAGGVGVQAGGVGLALDVRGAPPPLPSGAVPLPQQAGGGIAEASATTVRTVITGSGAAKGDGAARVEAAAGVIGGFEGVALDAEAQAAIAAALEACAARARAVDEAIEEGGEAAADAEEASGEPFVRLTQDCSPYRATLEWPTTYEEFVPFTPGEPHWTLAGLEMSPERAEVEARLEARARGEGAVSAGDGLPEAAGPSRE